MNERFTKNIILVSNTSGGGGGGGTSYSYSVANYSDLPLNPPNEIKIRVTGETVVDAIVQFSMGWRLIYGVVMSENDLPSDPVYTDPDRDIYIATGAVIINYGVSPYTAYLYDGAWLQFHPDGFVDQTIYANSVALELAYAAAAYPGSYGLVQDGPYVRVYLSDSNVWQMLGDIIPGFIGNLSGTPLLTDAAELESLYPAIDNTGSYGLAYLSGIPRVYESDGSSWNLQDTLPTDFVSQAIYANASALQTAFPAASYTNMYGLATESLVTKLYRSNGSAWLQIAPSVESASIVGSYAGDTAANTAYTNGSWSRRTGDLYTDSASAGTTLKRWSGAAWQHYLISWDGVSAGQTVADLSALTPVYTGAIAVIGVRAFKYSGSWSELLPGTSANWGSYAGDTAINNEIVTTYRRTGDTYTDSSSAGTYIKYWTGIAWRAFRITWDGASAGQTVADLPATAVTNAIAVVGVRGFRWNGSAWVELIPGSATIWSSYAGDTAANTAIGTGFQRTGDQYTDSTGAGTTAKRWSGSVWQIFRLDWDGTTAGQRVSDLPSSAIYTGAIATVGSRAFEYSGAAWVEQYPDVSVTTFANLPVSAPTGYLALVTAESGLTSALVRKTSTAGEWALERVTCAETVYGAIEWGTTPGQWYNTGGISVVTADGATVSDSTYAMQVRWSSSISRFVPQFVYGATIAGLFSIKGDSASPSSWTPTTTNADGTASISTASNRVTLSATTSAGASTDTIAQLQATDASLSSASNCYFKAILQRTALTTATGVALWRITIADGTDAYDFGDYQNNASNTAIGQWYDGNAGTLYAAQSTNTSDTFTARTMVEIVKRGTKAMARVGGGNGIWTDISGATARNSTGTVYAIRTQARRSAGTSTATITVERCNAMRFS